MKKTLALFSCIALLFGAVSTAQAGLSLAGLYGTMDTDSLDKGDYYGAQLECGLGPISAVLRGGYATNFDALEFEDSGVLGSPSMSNFLDSLGISSKYAKFDDFGIVPIELGAIVRFPVLGNFVDIYGGGGVGYYFIPGIKVRSSSFSFEIDNVDDIWGGWACVGVEASLAIVHVFAEAKYTWASSEKEIVFDGRDLGTSLDIDLSGMTFLVGLRLGF